MRRHLVMAARLIGRLDSIWSLWKPTELTDWSIPRSLYQKNSNLIGIAEALVDAATNTGNPLLGDLTDHLVDESTPDDEFLALVASGKAEAKGETSKVSKPKEREEKAEEEEADVELIGALDRLLIYLRLVYSIDFYAPAIYPRESDMPHPCGIMHVRPSKMPPMATELTALRIVPSAPSPVFRKELTASSAHKV